MFDQLLQCIKLGSCGDVVAAVIKLADFVVLHIVPLHVIPVTYGERVGSWKKETNICIILFFTRHTPCQSQSSVESYQCHIPVKNQYLSLSHSP